MRTSIRSFLATAAVCGACLPAAAQDGAGPEDGFYGALTGALHFDGEVKLDGRGRSGSDDLDAGPGVTAAVGREFRQAEGWALRGEAELGYRRFEAGDVEITDIPLMANGFIDVDIPAVRGLRGYAGLGLGAVWVKGSGISVSPSSVSDRNGLALGYQAMVGASYALDDRWTLFGGYRYFGTTKGKAFEVDNGVDTSDVRGSVRAHILEVGLRYRF